MASPRERASSIIITISAAWEDAFMALAKLPCPHCGTESAPFDLVDWYIHPKQMNLRVLLRCNICAEPIISNYADGAVREWAEERRKVFPDEISPNWSWPKTTAPIAPNGVPSNIAALYVQAMTSFKRGHYDAAGPLFRRIVEASVKKIHPEGKGSLFDRINGLPDELGVTPTMKRWAHNVRIIGREAAHEEDAISPEDANDMQAFVELFLNYAFDMQGRVDRYAPEPRAAS
jgi:hypothetical protein